MNILGIETSCDETAAAVVKDGKEILSSAVASSENLQKKFGGIFPEHASRQQLKLIIPVIQQALNKAFPYAMCNIDAIAVTYGPGLIGSLIIGVETAKTFSFFLKKPLIPVNHLHGHIYANFLEQKKKIVFPAVCLVASGGHTDLVLMKKSHTFKWLGGTRDDAAGECFDKTARMLGLGYPGGPEIEKSAGSRKHPASKKKLETGNWKLETKFSLPRPMINDDNFDFSFSGLKTAVIQKLPDARRQIPAKKFISQMAWEIQEAITDCLVKKTIKAAEKHKAKSILAGGGVAANLRLREKLKKTIGQSCNRAIELFIPNKKLCADNAAVIASAAYFQNKLVDWRNLKPNPSLHF